MQTTGPTTPQSGDTRAAIGKTLRTGGLRVTAQRIAVLGWLADHPHSSAHEVRSGVRAQLGAVSVQAIYDVLGACSAVGLVRRIDPAGHSARFECRVGDNHHHVVCRRCGRIEDTDCPAAKRPCLTPVDDHGFAIDEAEVVFWGVCLCCQADAAPGQASPKSN